MPIIDGQKQAEIVTEVELANNIKQEEEDDGESRITHVNTSRNSGDWTVLSERNQVTQCM